MDDVFDTINSLVPLEPPQRIWDNIERQLGSFIPQKMIFFFVISSVCVAITAVAVVSKVDEEYYPSVQLEIHYKHE